MLLKRIASRAAGRLANRIVGWADRRVAAQRKTLEEVLLNEAARADAYNNALVLTHRRAEGAVETLTDVVGALVLSRGADALEGGKLFLSAELVAAAASLPPVYFEQDDAGNYTLSFPEPDDSACAENESCPNCFGDEVHEG